MISQLKKVLLEKAGEWSLPSDGEWNFFLNNNYHPHCSNLNLLWFHGADEFPRVVTKLYRSPEILRQEFRNLQRAYGAASQWVPRPLTLGSLEGFWETLWMEGVPGLRIDPRNGNAGRKLPSLFEAVALIHSGLRKAEPADPERYRRMILEPLQTVAQFGESAAVKEGCAKALECSSEKWLESLVVIPQHGDLFFSNVLSHQDRWYVVDWESFGVIDLPFYDALTLLFSLLRAGGETPEQWDPMLARQASVLIELYARKLGLSSLEVPWLLPLTLANWFHLQWRDGRKEFTRLMYRTIEHYFEHQNVWNNVFVPAASPRIA